MDNTDLISRASLLAGIAELKQSPWYNRGNYEGDFNDMTIQSTINLIRYSERKETVETIIDICIKKEPVVLVDSDWISVKDELPKADGKYMVWRDGEWEICEFDAEYQRFGYTYEDYDEMYSRLIGWDDTIHDDVTHWMPLPEKPKEDKDE